MEVLLELQRVQGQLQPFLQRYQAVLGSASTADYNNNVSRGWEGWDLGLSPLPGEWYNPGETKAGAFPPFLWYNPGESVAGYFFSYSGMV